MKLLRSVKNSLERFILSHDDDIVVIEKFDERLTPNMRALRLAMSVADSLLSMGIPASDVASMALDITDRYCKRRVQVDVSSTLLMLSQDRGNEREPLTLVRSVPVRSTNDQQIQEIQELVRNIHRRGVPLDEAERRLDEIYTNPRKYPIAITTIGSASISAGVGMVLGAAPIILVLMFLSGAVAATGLRILARRRMPAFFSQVVAAGFITVMAGYIAWLSLHSDSTMLADVNPGFIVVGGIVMLVAGLAIVGAVQDAIDEFYVTANARLLKVTMMTAGIVVGVMMGIYFSKKFGVWIDPTPTANKETPEILQYAGVIMIAGGYALSNHSRLTGVLVSSAVGSLSWFIFSEALGTGLSSIAASGIAAASAGAVSTLFSRFWRVPSIALTTAGIIPLVPGLTLYNGLMAVFIDTSTGATSDSGTATLMTALFIALAIAGGVSFGTLVARPVRRTLIRARNRLPRRRLTH